MGESKEGGGSNRQVATDKVAAAVAAEAVSSGRELSRLTVQRVTEGIYMVELWVHGEPEPERFMYSEEELRGNMTANDPPPGESVSEHNG